MAEHFQAKKEFWQRGRDPGKSHRNGCTLLRNEVVLAKTGVQVAVT
jgi:hypothetical protein